MKHITLFIFLSTVKICRAANILYVTPYPLMSHNIMLSPIGLGLAHRGHNVTVITAFKEDRALENYHQIINNVVSHWTDTGKQAPNLFTLTDESQFKRQADRFKAGLRTTEAAISSTQIQEFLRKDNQFDVVICEAFLEEAFYMLAYKYKAPLILVTSISSNVKHNIATRNPLQLATVTYEQIFVTEPNSFYARLQNIFFGLYNYLWWRYWYLVKHEELAKKYIPGLTGDIPSLYNIQRNTSLYFLNGHFSFDNSVAYLPNIIQIGGIHLGQNNVSLPHNLKTILDQSKQGVIYVSFGSNLQSVDLPIQKRNAFVNVFKRTNLTVLWKWEDELFENKPNNIVTRRWFPQNEVLAHPNIKVFISHGGLLAIQEAVSHAVPVIGIPIFSDQNYNMLRVQDLGFGKILRYHDLNEENLEQILHEILADKSYKTKAEEISARFMDRPMSPMDTAIYWVEYVVRYKGADFMKNPALNLNWIAFNMLDVYAFVAVVTLTSAYFIFIIIKQLIKFCSDIAKAVYVSNERNI